MKSLLNLLDWLQSTHPELYNVLFNEISIDSFKSTKPPKISDEYNRFLTKISIFEARITYIRIEKLFCDMKAFSGTLSVEKVIEKLSIRSESERKEEETYGFSLSKALYGIFIVKVDDEQALELVKKRFSEYEVIRVSGVFVF